MILKQWSEILRNVTMLSQLGLSFITPLLLCLALCWFIISKTGVGGWIYIPGFFFGMGGSATVAYKFYLSVNKQEKKKHKKIKYILTDIHKHQHEGQNKGKEVTVWHFF